MTTRNTEFPCDSCGEPLTDRELANSIDSSSAERLCAKCDDWHELGIDTWDVGDNLQRGHIDKVASQAQVGEIARLTGSLILVRHTKLHAIIYREHSDDHATTTAVGVVSY